MSKEATTSVQSVDIDIDALLGTGADNVMLADEGVQGKPDKKPGMFSPMSTDTSFLDKPEPAKVEKTPEELAAETLAAEDAKAAKAVADATKTPEELEDERLAAEAADAIDPFALPGPDDLGTDDKNKGGRPTVMVSAVKNLIEKGTFVPFDDGKKLEDYTQEDFEELIQANLDNKESELVEELPKQFINQLPTEMQQAYNYISNGGTDLKGMFQALAASNEVKDLDISKEAGQKYAIRAYLQATNYGTPDEIEDEIYSLEDRGDLEKKAAQFKPKLDAMQEQIVQKRVAEQAASAKQRQQQSQVYIENVYSTLEKGELNGLKLDNKTQNMLYSGLVQSNYPSISGKQTNQLGHLLEKYQWVEPRHDLIAEALWLLSEPDAYRASLGAGVTKEVNEKTLRTLKTEQSSKGAGNTAPSASDTGGRKTAKRPGVQRPSKNFFGR